jgi:hypothetical protein
VGRQVHEDLRVDVELILEVVGEYREIFEIVLKFVVRR